MNSCIGRPATKFALFVLAAALAAPVVLPTSHAAGIEDTAGPIQFNRFQQPRALQPQSLAMPKAPSLDDLIVRTPFTLANLNPIWLKGAPISGLHPKSVETLGSTYFVVVDNSKIPRMSDLYRWNRLNGKSNYVTADSIIHPYFAFTNRLLAEAIVREMVPDLRSLLYAMQKVAVDDYKYADDKDVRRDVAANLAYVGTALRLLDEHYEAPNLSSVPEMVDQEVHNIMTGTTARSAVFDGVQDYSVFVPIGWYNSSKQLKNFYRCREWLSLVPFAITDSSTGRANNTFRRSVLMYRSLSQANILGRPAMDTWKKLVTAYGLLGARLASYHQRTLYPDDYELVLQERASALAVTLQSLAEPFFRTKLMLAVRNSKNNTLESESVLQMSDADSTSIAGVFRLFPMFGAPELPWLRAVAPMYPGAKDAGASWPLSLLDMYAWGSAQAGNVLSYSLPVLDQRIAYVLPALQRCVVHRSAGGQLSPLDNRTWNILSALFKPMADNTPGVLRTDAWYTQRLLSASAGFVDSLCAISPELPPAQTVANTAAVAANRGLAPQAVPARHGNAGTAVPEGNTAESMGRINPQEQPDQAPRRVHHVVAYHYLEPNPELFKRLQADATKLKTDLEAAGCFPAQYADELNDFVRLFGRLQKIADTETKGESISVLDRRLLANIDQVLDKVDVPLAEVLPVNGGSAMVQNDAQSGFNMAVGNAGMLCIVYQNPHTMEWTLGRGAVYTYYELPTPLLTKAMWEHKLEAGFAVPPAWTKRFEMVQAAVPEHR